MPLLSQGGSDDFDRKWKEAFKKHFDEKARLEAAQKPKEDKIIELLEELKTKFDKQNDLIQKIASTVSKMYQDGEINKDTFNKLDDFLRPYYENLYMDDHP